jgi:hypothetical protein
MARFNLKANLTASGGVNSAYFYLEILPEVDFPFATAIGLTPKNAQKIEWNNNNVHVEVIGSLEIQINVHAFRGTAWQFKLINKDNSDVLLDIKGTTGSNRSNGLNVSIERYSVDI